MFVQDGFLYLIVTKHKLTVWQMLGILLIYNLTALLIRKTYFCFRLLQPN